MGDIIIYIIAGFLGIVIVAWVFTWFFQPGKRLKYEKYQANVLKELAQKSGVDPAELDRIAKNTFV